MLAILLVSQEKFPATNIAALFCTFPNSSWRLVLEGSQTKLAYSRTGCINPFYAISFTSWLQANKFDFRNPSVLFALVQMWLTCLFHCRSWVIVTLRCLKLITFSSMVKVNVAWIFLTHFPISFILHLTGRNLAHTPVSRPSIESVYILLKFCWIPSVFNFKIQTQSSANRCISDSVPSEMSFMYKEDKRGPRTVPCGTPDMTGALSSLLPLAAILCGGKQRKASIHFIVYHLYHT